VAARINTSVDELDTTIRDIRTAIFELRSPTAAELRTDLRATVEAAAQSLGFRPHLELSGPIDSAVPAVIRPDLLAVVREALSNVVRHAQATAVEVSVSVAHGLLRVVVRDNGVGVAGAIDHGGLINLRERATRHGGTFAMEPAEPTGTVVTWSVPA
jgi:signal transduction histidine kinase